MKKRQFIILGSAIAIIALSVLGAKFAASFKEEPVAKKPPEAKKYVKTVPVAYQDVETVVRAFGRVETAQSLDLLSEVAGRMYQGKVRLKEGSNFKKGTLLFRIDDTEAELNLKSQKSNFLRDLAAILPDMKLDFDENFETWNGYFKNIKLDKDLPILPEVTDDKARTFLATKGIFSNYYNIKSAEVRLKKYNYYAPFDGSISQINFETGAFVNPGTNIGKIIRAGVHELRVSVESKDIAWINEGAPAQITSDESGLSWNGVVTRISDFVNQSTQSVDVYIAIEQTSKRLYDGQFLEATIPAQVIKDGMVIPRNLIYNGNEVFVLEDTLLKVKEIDIVRLTEQDAVFSGLTEGVDLVSEPLIGAYNNMKVFKNEDQDIDLETKNKKETELAASVSSDATASTN
ncbi:MAG: HlyD family efflux transporter periplasmic adaptor subunit [Cyclobacteriaceae bacterium]